jgi:hypothetical protein
MPILVLAAPGQEAEDVNSQRWTLARHLKNMDDHRQRDQRRLTKAGISLGLKIAGASLSSRAFNGMLSKIQLPDRQTVSSH